MNSKTWHPPTAYTMTTRASATNNSKQTTVPWSNHLSSMRSPENRFTGKKQCGPVNEWRDAYRSGVSSTLNKPMLKTPYDNSFKGETKETEDSMNRASHADIRPYGGHVQKDLLKYSEASEADVSPHSLYLRQTSQKHFGTSPGQEPLHSREHNENTPTGTSSSYSPKSNNLGEISKAGSGRVLSRSSPPLALGPLAGAGPLPSKKIDHNAIAKRYQYSYDESQRTGPSDSGHESPKAKQLGTNAVSKVSSLSSSRFESVTAESNSKNCHRNYMSKPNVPSYDQVSSQGLLNGKVHDIALPKLGHPCMSSGNHDVDNPNDGSAKASSDPFYDCPLPKQQMYLSKSNQIQSNPDPRNTCASNSSQYTSVCPLPMLNAECSKPDKNFTTNRVNDSATNFKKWNLDDSSCTLPKVGVDSCVNQNSLQPESDVLNAVQLPPRSGPNYQDDISKDGNANRELDNDNRDQSNTNNNGNKSQSSKKYEVSREIPESQYNDEQQSDTSDTSKRAATERKNPSWKTERNERYSSTVRTAGEKNDESRREFSAIDPAETGHVDRIRDPVGLVPELSENQASGKMKRNRGEENEIGAEAAHRSCVRQPLTNSDGLAREMTVPSYRKKKTSFTFNEDLITNMQNQLKVAQEVKRSEMETRPDFFNIGGLQSHYVPHSERPTSVTEASEGADPKLDYRRRKQTSDLWVPTFKRM